MNRNIGKHVAIPSFNELLYLKNYEEECDAAQPAGVLLQVARHRDVATVEILVSSKSIAALIRHGFVDVDVVERAIRSTAADLLKNGM